MSQNEHMQQPGLVYNLVDWSFWRRWSSFSAIGALLTWPIVALLFYSIPTNTSIWRVAIITLLVTISVIPVCIGQGVALQKDTHRAFNWIILSLVGSIIIFPLFILAAYTLSGEDGAFVIGSFSLGLAIGLPQYFFLRWYMRHAVLWIIISSVSWLMSLLGVGVVFSMLQTPYLQNNLFINSLQVVLVFVCHTALLGLALACLWQTQVHERETA